MTPQTRQNLLFIILFLICVVVQSIVAHAQAPTRKAYKGFEVNFASRSFQVNSDIAKISEANDAFAGGMIGLVYGGDWFKATLGLGYYSSGNKIAGTIDLYEAKLSTRLYPLELITRKGSRFSPYLTAGIARDNLKLYGYYINMEPGQTNYSQAEAPYLGSIQQTDATAGVGVQFKILDQHDFIHVFSEVLQSYNLASTSKATSFELTKIYQRTQIQVGVRFGAIR